MMTLEVVKQNKPTHRSISDRYKIIQDNEGCLVILDQETKEKRSWAVEDILYSGQFAQFSKPDVVKIGFIYGQKTKAIKNQ